MDVIAIIDVETQGLDPAVHRVVEIGCVLWSISQGCVIAAWSDLVQQASNEAEAINRIPVAALRMGLSQESAFTRLKNFVSRADVLVAHRAEFDAGFLPDLGKPWVCSKSDIEWPHSKPGDPLVYVALAHHVAVVSNHRSLTDCMLIAHAFESVRRDGADIELMFERAMRPKGHYQALVSYEQREKAKEAGFAWDAKERRWTRWMATEDVEKLGFPVQQLAAAV